VTRELQEWKKTVVAKNLELNSLQRQLKQAEATLAQARTILMGQAVRSVGTGDLECRKATVSAIKVLETRALPLDGEGRPDAD